MKTILLVSHVSETPGGPLDKFYAYLKEKYKVYRILHPILTTTDQKSAIDLGKKLIQYKIPSSLQYPLESLYTLVIWYRYFKTAPKIDLAICFDSLSYFHTYLCKKILRIDKIVYYNVDYSKKRFSNIFMNSVYQSITKFSYITCDYFFSFRNKFVEEVDPDGKYSNKHIVISTIIDLKSIKKGLKKYSNSLVYAGTIDYGTIDFGPLLEALTRLDKENVPFTLDLYGVASSGNPLQKEVNKRHLNKKIFFRGAVDNELLTQELLPLYTLGVAPYTTERTSPDHAFMNQDLTGKLVDYIGAGLPIISTRINDSFRLIDENKIGFSVVTIQDWYYALKTLLAGKSVYKTYSKNALLFAKNYDADSILIPLFQSIL